MQLFIIRHGESEGNVVSTDMPDPKLTELGQQQALFVEECMKTSNISSIISSPLIRAMETARPLARTLGLPIKVWKDVYEVRNKGLYIGPTLQQLKGMYPEAQFSNQFEADGWIYPGDETVDMSHRRAKQVYDRL